MWQLYIASSKAQKDWACLPPQVQQEIEQALLANPYYDPSRPRARKHIKGKIRGKNRRCHREYRRIEGGGRVFYAVDKENKQIRIEYVGPHP